MSDPIQMVQAASTAMASQSAVAAGAQPAMDPAAVDRFQQTMKSGEGTIPFVEQMSGTWQAAQGAHQTLLHRITALNAMRVEHHPSMAELLELQYDVANLTFEHDVVANVAKKASDAVQTLVKNG